MSARRGWNIETSSQVSVGFGPASPATAPKATKCDGSVIKTVPLWLRKCRRQAPVEGLREIWRSADDKSIGKKADWELEPSCIERATPAPLGSSNAPRDGEYGMKTFLRRLFGMETQSELPTRPKTTGLRMQKFGHDLVRNERSEERRVGKECGRKCRSRWSPEN